LAQAGDTEATKTVLRAFGDEAEEAADD